MAATYTNETLEAAVTAVGQTIREADQIVAFTGAGISTESGIPDFRSPDGIWANNRTVYFDEFLKHADDRHEYWRQKAVMGREFGDAQPNITHDTLAQMEASSRLRGIITQNIDGLHQLAGSRDVLELHGTARKVACLQCDWLDRAEPWNEEFLKHDRVPECPKCGGFVKHATVSFGQSLPQQTLQTAVEWARESDVFLALGSSLVVEPAASLPRIAAEAGSCLIIVNRDATPLDSIATVVVNAPLGSLFAHLNDAGDGS